jgi:hypothetical protein
LARSKRGPSYLILSSCTSSPRFAPISASSLEELRERIFAIDLVDCEPVVHTLTDEINEAA